MKKLLISAVLMIVTACASPLERCVNQATRVYRDALAEQRELNETLARGYEIRRDRVPYQRMVICTTKDDKTYPCWRTYYRIEERSVAVDLRAVQRRLDEIARQLPLLERSANEGAAQCRATLADA